ncbi:YegJ family protein [Gilvimarinus sp. F26214L]|uniref:YegJ family protein n=1 Tax=Gilvimarinus sp. DZF01 TaxID=3461371 RepID=UPI0040463323
MKHKTIFFGMILILAGLVAVQYSIKRQSGGASEADVELGGLIQAADDPQMQAAYDKARKTLDYFLGVANDPPPDTQGFSVKVGVQDNDLTEFFWVYPFDQEEEGFTGRINSEPQLVDNVFKGEIVSFQRGQIVDWTFEDTATEIMHGNYTGCVLLEREAPENAAQFQELYGLNCDK